MHTTILHAYTVLTRGLRKLTAPTYLGISTKPPTKPILDSEGLSRDEIPMLGDIKLLYFSHCISARNSNKLCGGYREKGFKKYRFAC